MRCIESLRNVSYLNHAVVLVDNGSSDGTESAVREKYDHVAVIQTHHNLGYTGGNNVGIEYAISNNADYVLILNSDTIVINPDFISEMINYMTENHDVGFAGPRVFLHQFGNIQNTVLSAPSLMRNIECWFRFRANHEFGHRSRNCIVEAGALNGVCLLIRSECIREIGLFDNNLFMYIEDHDMQYRAHLKGWRVRYLPIDSIVHYPTMAVYNLTGNVSFLIKRNSVYFLNKIGKRFDAVGLAVFCIGLTLLRAVIPFKEDGETFGDYIRFSKRLINAYLAILAGRIPSRDFGPPYC